MVDCVKRENCAICPGSKCWLARAPHEGRLSDHTTFVMNNDSNDEKEDTGVEEASITLHSMSDIHFLRIYLRAAAAAAVVAALEVANHA